MSRPGASEWHSYFWPGSTILRNKLGITDPAEFQLVEFDVVETRSHELRTGAHAVDRTFDSAHLKAIHAHLFSDLYDWAGHYRTVNISKTASDRRTNHFGDHASMDTYLRQVRIAVDATSWTRLPDDRLAHHLADVHTRLNFAHPFREGNGRATRFFMHHLAEHSGSELDFGRTPRDTWNSASAATFVHPHGLRLDSQPLEEIYRQILRRG